MTETAARRPRRVRLLRRGAPLLAFLAVLGPGLITGASDNDAQGITIYSQAGGRTGYELLWLLILSAIALVVTQEIGARLGMTTGKGLAALIRERFGVRPAAFAMLMLLVANLGTIASEFAGVAAALQIFHVSRFLSVPIAAMLVFLLVSRGSYRRVERVFLILSTFYIAYVISGILAHPNWGEALHGMFVPTFRTSATFVGIGVALIGTTVAPWGQFFIQAYVVDKGLGAEDLRFERADVFLGSTVTLVVGFFIMLATAATVHVKGLSIHTAADAARALEPLAGTFAASLFGLGLLNASFLAAGVLPLSTSYAICEAFGFEMGMDRRVREAPLFYGVLAFGILFGAGLVLLPGAPLLTILMVSGAVNGILLAPMLIYIYVLANDRELMGEMKNGRLANTLMLVTIVVLLALTAVLLVTSLAGGGG